MDYSKLSGPIIGAIIGYGTNWIAIKMLFRPLKPIKIGKFTLPFTPGIIPKRQEKIAKAIGESIANNLFTDNDIKQMLLDENIKDEVANSILKKLKDEKTFEEIIHEKIDDDKYFFSREKIKNLITKKVKDGLVEANIGEIIANEGKKIVSEKTKGSMLRMFVTDNMIDSMILPLGNSIQDYIEKHGEEKIEPKIDEEICLIERSSSKELFEKFEIDEDNLKKQIKELFEDFVNNHISNFLQKIDISKTIENKINEMEVAELEQILLSIMKKELGAIVNLGAYIGLILGTLNVFI